MRMSAFLPVKGQSKRVPMKNFLPLPGEPFGLFGRKLDHLCSTPSLDEIVVSSDSDSAKRIVEGRADPRLRFVQRPQGLAEDDTSIRQLCDHAVEVVGASHILWTHVTSPFFGPADYESAIESYFDALDRDFDSLMSVQTLNEFALFRGEPVNFGHSENYWPRTQDLEPVRILNSAVFIASSEVFRKYRNRIGPKVFCYETGKRQSFDVDTTTDMDELRTILAFEASL